MADDDSSDWRQRGGGIGGQSTAQSSSAQQIESGPHIGIYGWRKRCLYLLILALLILVIVNLALTLWVLKVMEFNTDGMGNLRVVAGGIQVSGQSYILGSLVATSIRSRNGQHMAFRSSQNLTLMTTNDHLVTNTMTLGNDRLDCTASRFKVSDLQGRTLFSADKNEVIVGADMLRVTGPGGVIFDGSIQTPLVRAGAGSDLSLESPTRSLQILAPAGISIESRAGGISVSCLSDLKLQSLDGAIRLEASRVLLPELKIGQHRPASQYSRSSQSSSASTVYQLCSCSNGKLFLAPSDGLCATDNENSVCR